MSLDIHVTQESEQKPALTFAEYQKQTATTAIYPGRGELVGILYTALGLGESGEIQNKVKKILRDTNGVLTQETREKLLDELGDLNWYISQLCTELGGSLGAVAQKNLDKLKSRQERGVISGSGDNR